MALKQLLDLPLPNERSICFIPIPGIKDPKIREQLVLDHKRIGNLEFSTCLHPDPRDYFVEVANTMGLGAIYYPLYTIAEQLSFVGLELALRARFSFEQRKRSGFRELLNLAIERGCIPFEKTKAVLSSYMKATEQHHIAPKIFQPHRIEDIAMNRRRLLQNDLPEMRNQAFHPHLAPLKMPPSAFAALELTLELANLVYEESEQELKAFAMDGGFAFHNLDVESAARSHGLERVDLINHPSPLSRSDFVDGIERAAGYLGIVLKPSIAVDVLQQLGLVTNVARDAFPELFSSQNAKRELHYDLNKQLSNYLVYLEERLSGMKDEICLVESGHRFTASFHSDGAESHWILASSDASDGPLCRIGTNDLSYYHFMKAGLAPTLTNITAEIRGLSTILGQKSDALSWYQLHWPPNR